MVTGGVKAGKSTFAVYLAIKHWRKRVRRTKFINFFRKLFKKPLLDLPLLYSNIPLDVPYVPFRRDLLLRNERFVYGSVVYLGEFSLVANSMNFKDDLLNERINLFCKLFGHETRGGLCIVDTQCIGDVHFGLKRSISEYYYVHHTNKCIGLPFIFAYVKECRYSDDGTVITAETKDVEDDLRIVFIPKRIWKCFDAYCYSSFTDHLTVVSDVDDDGIKPVTEIVSFNRFKTINNKVVNNNDTQT